MNRNFIAFTSYIKSFLLATGPFTQCTKMELKESAVFIGKATANICTYEILLLSAYEGYFKDKPKHHIGMVL